uniref:Uncharacterized protein n=1 Tax=Oryzias latipes TaxID=8090 RepID=A0A3P9KMS3_ORYLA
HDHQSTFRSGIMTAVRNGPKTTRQELVGDLKAAGTTTCRPRVVGRRCCGQMRPTWSSLGSTEPVVFGGREMLPVTPRTPSPLPSMEVETSCFGVFLHCVDGRMGGAMYHQILSQNLLPPSRRLKGVVDHGPKHSAKTTKERLKYKQIRNIESQSVSGPQSPEKPRDDRLLDSFRNEQTPKISKGSNSLQCIQMLFFLKRKRNLTVYVCLHVN